MRWMFSRAVPILAVLAAGCDSGSSNESTTFGGGPVAKVASNIDGKMLAADARIELAFNRLLLPAAISSQTFALLDSLGRAVPADVGYDPVAIVVTVKPQAQLTESDYTLAIVPPASSTDINGLRAIDGTPLAAKVTLPFTAGPAGSPPAAITVDYCKDVNPIFTYNCSPPQCHGGTMPAEGLTLTTVAGVRSTAIGKAAHEANTGPRAGPAMSPQLLFDEDMPIIDADPAQGVGRPGHSRLLYKLLMALSTDTPTTPDAGAPTSLVGLYSVLPQGTAPLPNGERTILTNLLPGREMPFPYPMVLPMPQIETYSLSIDQWERLSLWIAQGAGTPDTCP